MKTARSLGVVLLAGLSCGLAACGSAASDDQSSTHDRAAAQAVPADQLAPECGKDTRTIKHELGTTHRRWQAAAGRRARAALDTSMTRGLGMAQSSFTLGALLQ